MKQINPIFEALSNVDERHIPITKAKKHSKKLKIALISAAAAAALALIVGFASSSGGQHRFAFNANGSIDHGFYLDLTPQEFNVPERFKANLGDHAYFGCESVLPTELFQEFGITPLINDNFIDTKDVKLSRTDLLNNKSTWEPLIRIDYFNGSATDVEFDYFLYDKNLGENIRFTALYVVNPDKLEYSNHMGLQSEAEIVTLNNGSLCMISDEVAVFSYNGVSYELTFDDFSKPHTIDTVKQVLTDLGVL